MPFGTGRYNQPVVVGPGSNSNKGNPLAGATLRPEGYVNGGIPDDISPIWGSNPQTTESISEWLVAHNNPTVPAPSYGGGAGSYAAALQAYLGQMLGMRKDMYDQGLNYYQQAYDASKQQLMGQNENNQRENYITHMMNQRDFGQMNTAQGLTGGASESAAASLYNQYLANRNATDQNTNNNLASLLAQLNENKYNLYNQYLAGMMDDYSNYYNSMISHLGSGGSSYASNAGSTLASLLAQGQEAYAIQQMLKNGYSEADINRAISAM